MRIRILVVGRIKEEYIKRGIDEFLKRLRLYCRVAVVEVGNSPKPRRLSGVHIEKAIEEEGENLLKAIAPEEFKIALDVKGRQISSEGLAAYLEQLMTRGDSSLCFIIGGTFGLSQQVLNAADQTFSLSNMTFTHEMIRLIFLEQLYRAFKIIRNEPYHY